MSIEKDAEHLISAVHPYRRPGHASVKLVVETDRVSAILRNDVTVMIMYADDTGEAFLAQVWRDKDGSQVFNLTRNSTGKLQRFLNSYCT